LALAYNILEEQGASDKVHKRNDSAGGPQTMPFPTMNGKEEHSPAQVTLLAALQIAACYADKTAGDQSCWTDLANDHNIDAEELWQASADMVERLGWRMCLLACPSSVDSALHTLEVEHLVPSICQPTTKQHATHARPTTGLVQTGYFD